MVEDGTTEPAVVATEPVVTEPAGQPTPLVSAEGELREGWRESLPEDIRSDKVFDRVSNFEGIMKSLSSAERAFGKEKISIPSEASSQAEWDSFYAAGGRPETAGDYGFARPEDFPEEHYNKEYADGIQEILFRRGGSKALADELFEFNNNFMLKQLAKNDQDAELEMSQLKDGLLADWGSAFQQKEHRGNVAIEEAASVIKNGVKEVNVEFKERLVQKAGSDPDIIRAFANLGAKFMEAGSVKTETIPTTGDIQTQIDDAMVHKSHGIDYASHGFTRTQHDSQVEKVRQLFEQKTKHLKTG